MSLFAELKRRHVWRVVIAYAAALHPIRKADPSPRSRIFDPCYTDSVLFDRRRSMANLTLSLDDEILQRAREAALRERTSVNAMVREYLTRYVDAKSRRLDAMDVLDDLAKRSKSRSTKAWSRDELHQR